MDITIHHRIWPREWVGYICPWMHCDCDVTTVQFPSAQGIREFHLNPLRCSASCEHLCNVINDIHPSEQDRGKLAQVKFDWNTANEWINESPIQMIHSKTDSFRNWTLHNNVLFGVWMKLLLSANCKKINQIMRLKCVTTQSLTSYFLNCCIKSIAH